MMRFFSLPYTIIRNRWRRPVLPRFLTYLVTYKCNARCIMCDSWKKPSRYDLTLPEIARIFNQLPRMDVVRLSGGEPFVRHDLIDIAHMAQTKLLPLVLHITTNGFLTEEIVAFCEKRRKDVPLQLLVSLDGMEKTHNRIRGVETAWKRATRTLESLAPRQKELRLTLSVNQVVVDAKGLDEYRNLHEYLRPLGIRHNFVMAYDASSTYSEEYESRVVKDQIGGFTTLNNFSRERLEEFFEEVERDLEERSLFERMAKRYYLKGIRSRLLEQRSFPNPRCVALNSHLRLLPNGLVPTCQFNGVTVGNLRHQSFEEIWAGAAIARQRKWVFHCAGCWAECEILPNALYTGDLFREVLYPRRHLPTRKSRPQTTPHPAQNT